MTQNVLINPHLILKEIFMVGLLLILLFFNYVFLRVIILNYDSWIVIPSSISLVMISLTFIVILKKLQNSSIHKFINNL